jgi:hypothetical protein
MIALYHRRDTTTSPFLPLVIEKSAPIPYFPRD